MTLRAGPLAAGDRVVVFSPHPDDVDFGAAGTVAQLTRRNVEVTYVIVTDGDRGSIEEDPDLEKLPSIRRREQSAAAARVGVSDVRFLGRGDGYVVADHELRRDISRILRELKPRLVICPSPERSWQRLPASHPDHLAVGEAVIRAIYPDARNPFMYPELLSEGLEPFEVKEVWLTGSPYAFAGPLEQPQELDPDPLSPVIYPGQVGTYLAAVDVTDTFEDKIAALSCHRSQIRDVERLRETVGGWLEAGAARYGLKGRKAELFQVVKLP